LYFSMLLLVVHMVVHLHNTHLTTYVAFSLTLNTISFEYSTLEWFAISTYIAIAIGLLSSFIQLRNSYRISRDTRNLVQYYIMLSLFVMPIKKNMRNFHPFSHVFLLCYTHFFILKCLWDNKNVAFFQTKNVGKPTFFLLSKMVKDGKIKVHQLTKS